jgi:hypothetical protein
MTTAYTSLLGLALPVDGELSGTWGTTVNDYITQYVDAAVAGVQTISGSQTSVTLSKTTGTSLSQAGSGATGSSQYAVINCTGNPAGLLTITAPAASKAYIVLNATSTNQSVSVVGAGPTTGVTLVAGEKAIVAWNGSDFVKVASSAVDGVSTISFGTTGLTPSTGTAGAVTVAGTLATTNGGTGLTSFTSGGAVYASSTSALTTGTLPIASGGTAATTASGARTSLGGTTVGSNFFTLSNPSAVTFPRINADNSVSALSANDFNTALGTVVGPASATDNAVARYDGTTGKLVQNSAVTIADDGATTITTTTAATNTVTNVLQVNSQSSSTPANNIGAGVQFAVETAAGNTEVGVTLEAVAVDTTSTSEDFDLNIKTMAAGAAAAQRLKVNSTGVTFSNSIVETVFPIVDGAAVDINPANGTIQTWTLGANRTPTANSFLEGQSVTLMIADGTSAYSVTWSTIGVVWTNGIQPSLPTSGYGVVVLWKVGTTVYGNFIGTVA